MGPIGSEKTINTAALFSGITIFYLTAYYGKVSLNFAILTAALIVAGEIFFRFLSAGIRLPYILMLTSPVSLVFYSTAADFQSRLFLLLLLIYIFVVPLRRPPREKKPDPVNPGPLLLWLVPFIIFSALSIWLDMKGVHLSGDEPHYLMVTQSIIEDGDILLKNNVENKTYLDFIPVEIPAHMIIHEGRHLSFHMPGLSFLLLPFYLLFKLSGSLVSPQLFFRLSASFINAFFPLVLFYIAKLYFPGRNIIRIWMISVLSVPLLFHSVHLFPELPASTLLAASFLLLFKEDPKPGLAGFLFSFTLWFHVKYYPALLVFALVAVWKLIREKNKKDVFLFLLFPGISSLLLLFYTKFFYGTFNPAAIFPAENYWLSPVLLKIKVFFAYFIDQRDGLFFYAPLLFLSLFGIRLKKALWTVPGMMIAAYVLFHSVTTVRGAHSPAGRPLMFVFWILLLYTFNYYFNTPRKYLFRVLSGFNFFVLAWMIIHPNFIYQPVFSGTTDGTSALLHSLGSSYLNIAGLFPSFLTRRIDFYPANIFWITALFILAVLFYSGRAPELRFSIRRARTSSILLFLVSMLLLAVYPHVHISPKDRVRTDGISLFNRSANLVWLDGEKRFRMKGNEEYTLYFEERNWKKDIRFSIDVPEASSIKIMNGRQFIFITDEPGRQVFEANLSVMKKLKFRGKHIVPVWIKTVSEKDSFFYMYLEGR